MLVQNSAASIVIFNQHTASAATKGSQISPAEEGGVLSSDTLSHGVSLEETGEGCFIYQKTFQHGSHYQSA